MKNIRALAEKLAAAEARIDMLGMLNQPSSLEDKIKADASMMLAQAARGKALKDYQDALDDFTTDELLSLSR